MTERSEGEGDHSGQPGVGSPLVWAALPVCYPFAGDSRAFASCTASFGRSVRGAAADVRARPTSQRFAGAGAHELRDVLTVAAFSATDHLAQRDTEG